MTIPEQIKEKRRALKENQKQFGKRFGVTQHTVSRWESGMRYPRSKKLEEVMKVVQNK